MNVQQKKMISKIKEFWMILNILKEWTFLYSLFTFVISWGGNSVIKITQPCRNRQHSNLFSINYHYSSSFEIKLQKLGMIYFPKKYSLCQIMVQIIQNVISAVQIGQIQYSVMTIHSYRLKLNFSRSYEV